MRNVSVRTSKGLVRITPPEVSDRPVLLFLHGLFRAPRDDLQALFPDFDVAYGYLPGHAGADVFEDSGINAMGRAFAEVLGSSAFAGRRVLFVGESLGGVVGVRVATFALPNLTGVVAIDPFWSTAKLWPIGGALDAARVQGYPEPERIIDDVFGLLSDRDFVYFPMLPALTVPLTVIRGDVPLHPEREMRETPSLMDDADARMLARFPRVKVQQIAGEHRLLDRSPAAVAALVVAAQRDQDVLARDRAG